MAGGMEWVRKTYGVPAKRGGRVEYAGDGRPELGTIISATTSGYLKVELDSHPRAIKLHPTWKLRYLDADSPQEVSNAAQ